MIKRMYRLPEVMTITGLSRSSIYLRMSILNYVAEQIMAGGPLALVHPARPLANNRRRGDAGDEA